MKEDADQINSAPPTSSLWRPGTHDVETRHRWPRLASRLKSSLSVLPVVIEIDNQWPRHLPGKLRVHEAIGLTAPKLTMGLLQAQKTGSLAQLKPRLWLHRAEEAEQLSLPRNRTEARQRARPMVQGVRPMRGYRFVQVKGEFIKKISNSLNLIHLILFR